MPEFSDDVIYEPHWLINDDKCFTITPKKSINIRGLNIPQDILSKLSEEANRLMDWSLEEKELFEKRLEYHLGQESTYVNKRKRIHDLKVIYARLKGLLDEDLGPIDANGKTAIFNKLFEDIEYCTGGFNNRIVFLVAGFILPETFDEVILFIRNELVIMASSVVSDVHDQNYFFTRAFNTKLAVYPIDEDDPCEISITESFADKHLADTFSENYTPFYLANQFITVLKSFMQTIHYTGPRVDEGYVKQEYEKFIEYLDGLFQTNHQYDLLVLDENTYHILDINWNFIKKMLWQRLMDEKYFEFYHLKPVADILFDADNDDISTLSAIEVNEFSNVFQKQSDLINALNFFDYLSTDKHHAMITIWLIKALTAEETNAYETVFAIYWQMAMENHPNFNLFLETLKHLDIHLLKKIIDFDESGERYSLLNLLENKKMDSISIILDYLDCFSTREKKNLLLVKTNFHETLCSLLLKSNTVIALKLVQMLQKESDLTKSTFLNLSKNKYSAVFSPFLLLENEINKATNEEESDVEGAKLVCDKLFQLCQKRNVRDREGMFLLKGKTGGSFFIYALRLYPNLAKKMAAMLSAFSIDSKKEILFHYKSNKADILRVATLYAPIVLPYIFAIYDGFLNTNDSRKRKRRSIDSYQEMHQESVETYNSIVQSLSVPVVNSESLIVYLLKHEKEFPLSLVDLVSKLEKRDVIDLLSMTDIDNQNILMLAIKHHPKLFLTLNHLCLTHFKDLNKLYVNGSCYGDTLLTLAIKSDSAQILNSVFFAFNQLPYANKLDLYTHRMIANQQNPLMLAILSSNKIAQVFINGLNKEPSSIKLSILSLLDNNGWNAFYYALKNKSAIARYILSMLIELSETNPQKVLAVISILVQNSSALMVILRSQLQLSEDFLVLMKKFSFQEQYRLITPISYLGNNALFMAISKNSLFLPHFIEVLNHLPNYQCQSLLLNTYLGDTPLSLSLRVNGLFSNQLLSLYIKVIGFSQSLELISTASWALNETTTKELIISLLDCYQSKYSAIEKDSMLTLFFQPSFSNSDKCKLAEKIKNELTSSTGLTFDNYLDYQEQAGSCGELSKLMSLLPVTAHHWTAKSKI